MVLPDTSPDADVSVQVLAADTRPTPSAFDPDTGSWNTLLAVPAGPPRPTAVEFVVRAALPDSATATSAPWSIPVADVAGPIVPTIIPIDGDPVIVLPWGDGAGEVGYLDAGDEGEDGQPTALSIDPRNGNIVVLDSVNQRVLVVAGPDVVDTIDLPDAPDTFVTDIVVNGDSGTATVTGFVVGTAETLAMIVDLDTPRVNVVGPRSIPRTTPINAPSVWNDTVGSVFVRIGNDFYPYLDLERRVLQAGAAPTRWIDLSVSPDGSITLGSGESAITIAFGLMSGGVTDVQFDDHIWIVTSTIDPEAPPEAVVQYLLVRVEPEAGRAVAVEIPGSGLTTATKQLAVHDGDAHLMRVTNEGLVIERYQPPTD